MGFIGDITGKAIGWVIYLIGYVFISFLSVLIAALAWLLKGLMVLNQMVVNLSVVKVGYAIISQLMDPVIMVITIIVIFRLLLWGGKYGERNMYLAIFASYVMIHYGLLITGWIPTVSDRMAYYFLDKSMPESGLTAVVGDVTGAPDGIKNMATQDKYFVDAIVGSLKPQAIFAVGTNASSTGDTVAYLGGAGSIKGFASILQPLLGLIMGIILCLIIIVAVLALIFMYLGRFFILPIDFFTFPFVCVAFIFGSLRHHWYSWWSRHISWSIRPAIAILFIYLAITTSSKFNDYFGGWLNDPANGLLYPDSNTIGFLGAIGKNIFGPMFQIIIVSGMIIGGLIVSFSLSLHFSDAAVAGAQTAAGAIIEKASSGNRRWLKRAAEGIGGASNGLGGSRQLTTLKPLRSAGAPVLNGGAAGATSVAPRAQIALSDRDKIQKRIAAVENTRDRAATPGEKQAAEAALGRLREKESAMSRDGSNATNTAQITKEEIIKPIRQIETHKDPIPQEAAVQITQKTNPMTRAANTPIRLSDNQSEQRNEPVSLSNLRKDGVNDPSNNQGSLSGAAKGLPGALAADTDKAAVDNNTLASILIDTQGVSEPGRIKGGDTAEYVTQKDNSSVLNKAVLEMATRVIKNDTDAQLKTGEDELLERVIRRTEQTTLESNEEEVKSTESQGESTTTTKQPIIINGKKDKEQTAGRGVLEEVLIMDDMLNGLNPKTEGGRVLKMPLPTDTQQNNPQLKRAA